MGATCAESFVRSILGGIWKTARRIGIYETKISTISKTKVDIRAKKVKPDVLCENHSVVTDSS